MSAATQEVLREDSAFTKLAFARLLEWLDDGVESHGERYVEMRRRLVSYFDRRNRPFADELADETFNRIARTLEESGRILVTPPARYCYVVARFVLLEDVRRARRFIPVDDARWPAPSGVVDRSTELREQRLQCLDRCLDALAPEQRELAIEYYRDAKRQRIERRRALASRLGISINALGIRASRLRTALEACLDACSAGR